MMQLFTILKRIYIYAIKFFYDSSNLIGAGDFNSRIGECKGQWMSVD